MQQIKTKINDLIVSKQGILLSDNVSLNKPISISCSNKHTFELKYIELIKEQWCPLCMSKNENNYDPLYQALDTIGCEYKKDIEYHHFHFHIMITDDTTILIDIENNETSLLHVEDKIQMITQNDQIKYIILKYDTLQKENLDIFLLELFSSEDQIYFDEHRELITSNELVTSNNKHYVKKESPKKESIVVPQKPVSRFTKPIIKRALGYIRVSLEKQAVNGVSLDAQETSIIEYVKSKGYQLYKIYKDAGISGKNINERPELLKLLDDLQTNDVVVCYSLSRLTRNVKDSVYIKTYIEDKGASLEMIDVPYENSASGDMIFHIQNSVNQFERVQIGNRVSHCLNDLSHKKLLKSKPIFGFKYVQKKKKFEKDIDEQYILGRIKELYMGQELECPTLTKICNVLNNEKLPCRKAKKWVPNRLKNILIQHGLYKSEINPELYNLED